MTPALPTSCNSLLVPRRTGTPGDDLVAWGLAILTSEIANDDVRIVDAGTCFRVELPVPYDTLPQLVEQNGAPVRARLRWLRKTGDTPNPYEPPPGILWVDRDELRQAFRTAGQAADLAREPSGGDGPAVTVTADPRQYPLYAPLTNPGTQWRGYNRLVQAAEKLVTAKGIQLLLRCYDPTSPLDATQIDDGLRQLGLGNAKDRWRNAPGFLYAGLNKGPTMRVNLGATTAGDPTKPDWVMIDRGDRSLVELYLAYVGYFSVAQVMDDAQGRSVLIPAPSRVVIPPALHALQSVRLPGRGPLAYLRASAALQYSKAALAYLESMQKRNPEEPEETDLAFHGVYLARYWKPSDNTYAPIRLGLVPLPIWLGPIRGQGFGYARTILAHHAHRIRQVRGTRPERRLPSERRAAIEAYEASLGADAQSWFRAVALWWPVLRVSHTEVPKEPYPVTLWDITQTEEIAVALQPDLQEVIHSEAFQNVTRAIRAATVRAHFARLRARHGGPRAPFEPQYDLITTLSEAAERHPQEFLRELYCFAARFNDETMRKNDDAPKDNRRSMITEDDLTRVSEWVNKDRHRIVPAALIAFGSSRLGRSDAPPTGDGSMPDDDALDIDEFDQAEAAEGGAVETERSQS